MTKHFAFACRMAVATPKIGASSSCGCSSIVAMLTASPPGRWTAITRSNAPLAAATTRPRSVVSPNRTSVFGSPILRDRPPTRMYAFMLRVYPLAVRVTVIIPTLDEAGRVGAAIDSAFAAGADEVIVADGGSNDGTLTVAREHGARVIEGETMRSRQMNRAAAAARHEALVFLHADTRLPAGACALVAEALANGADFGGFRLQFAERAYRLRLAAALINFRTRLTRCPWGDQAQFIARNAF